MKSARHLVKSFVPNAYNLTLHIQKEALQFHGSVTIEGRLMRPAQRITLHQRGLQITNATITRHDKQREASHEVKRIVHQASYDEVRLHTDDRLYPGDYTVTLEFKGEVTAKMLGIYPSYVTNDDGSKDTIIATQFESHYAREVFPCVDEPAAKATFDLTVVLPLGSTDVVLSNTPAVADEMVDHGRAISFETTPRMSTYLLAFVIGDLHCVESQTKDGVTVRSWGHVSRPKEHLQYSVDEAVAALEFFTEYFGTPYPLAKCDQVALPDFDAGAMENWGLITYREIALLADPENLSISSQQYISLVIAHELSHQWFGNLVTMQWWDDLWLNESFASIMEHLALDVMHPDWHQWEMYVAMDVLGASNRDVYKDIQSVGVKVTDPELIDTLFDPGIVYAKGGRLIKMMREYVGEEAFRAALKIYFQRHQYANTTREDLWKVMSETSGKDVAALMTPWIEQSGMPVLSIDETEPALVVSQQRFVLDAENDATLWPIPLFTETKVEPEILIGKHFKLKSESPDYVLFNQFASAHYVCRYVQAEHRAALNKRMAEVDLPTEARIGLLNDSLLLAKRGDASLVESLETVSALSREPRDHVWGLVSRTIGSAQQLTEGDEIAAKQLRALRRKLAADWYKKLGWDDAEGDDPNTKQLRHTALSLMIGGEDEAALKEANKRYEATDNLEALPAELRSTILAVAVRHGKATNVDRLIELYKTATSEMQLDITSALSSTKDPAVAERILNTMLGPKGIVRNQDVMRWIAYFMRNHYVRQTTWDWMVANWNWLNAELGPSKSFDYLPVYCSAVITTQDWAKKYREFFEPKLSNKTLQRNIQVGFSDIEARVAWRKRDEQAIKDWLSATQL